MVMFDWFGLRKKMFRNILDFSSDANFRHHFVSPTIFHSLAAYKHFINCLKQTNVAVSKLWSLNRMTI